MNQLYLPPPTPKTGKPNIFRPTNDLSGSFCPSTTTWCYILYLPFQPEMRGEAWPDSAAHQGTVTLEGKVKKPPLALHSLLSEGTETPRQVCMAQLLGPAGKDFKNKCEFQLQHCA